MISPEVLRRNPFFNELNPEQLKQIAMIASEEFIQKGTTLFIEEQSADLLYVLMDGNVDLLFTIQFEKPQKIKEIVIGEINPGEPFGISALIEPYLYTSTARVASDCHVVKIPATQLRNLCNSDQTIAYCLMHKVAKAAIQRLTATRVQLAAAYA